MKSRHVGRIIRDKTVLVIALATAALLSIPLVAMQFTDEVNWTLSDFIVAGALLFGTGLIYEFTVRKTQNTSNRIIIAIVLGGAFLLVWAELAVGIFGTPIAGN